MRLKKLNCDTAIDSKGKGWFLIYTGTRHTQWKRCDNCDKTIQFYWTEWPDRKTKLCDNCIDWSNNEVS
jgi:hypothetical protein